MYARSTLSSAGTVTFIPPVTTQVPPLVTASVTVTPLTSTLFGLATVIVPVAFHPLAVPASCVAFTV